MSDGQHISSKLLSTSLSWLPMATLLYLVRFHIGPLPTTLLEIYIGLIVMLFTIAHGASGWVVAWSRVRSWRAPIMAWLIVTFIAVFVSPDHWAGLGLWRAYVLEPLLVFVVLAGTIESEQAQQALRRSLFLVTIMLGVWAAIQFLTGRGIPHPWNVGILEGRRATGPFPYPNALALFVVPIGAWAFAQWSTKLRNFAKIQKENLRFAICDLRFFAWLSALFVILLARSDGGLVAFATVVIVTLLLHRSTRRWAALVIGALIFIVLLLEPIRTPLWRELSFQSWSGQVRLFQWRETRYMLTDHWFFGAGFGGYPTVFEPYHRAKAIEIFQYPHNILLNFWSETGILGVLVFGWILVRWAAHSSQLTAHSWIKIAPLVAILIHGLVDVPYFKNDLAVLFWMLVFLTTFRFFSPNEGAGIEASVSELRGG